MFAPAAAAAATSPMKFPAVGQPPEGHTICPHTCGCVKYGSVRVQGRLSFKNLKNHLRGNKAHPLCSPMCPAFVLNMQCDEALSDSDDSEWGDGSKPVKRKATDNAPPPPMLALSHQPSERSVPVLAPMQEPSPKKARSTPEPEAAASVANQAPYMPAAEFQVAASSAQGLYMTSSQYQAAILAKVDDQVATLRLRFGKAQVEALNEMRESEIRLDCSGIGKAAIERFGAEIKRAGFDGMRCVQAEDMCYVVEM